MKRFFLISMLAVLLFVVVCPLTPTPTAVVNGKIQSLLPHPVAMLAACLAALLTLKKISILAASSEELTHGTYDVVDLTCVRLC